MSEAAESAWEAHRESLYRSNAVFGPRLPFVVGYDAGLAAATEGGVEWGVRFYGRGPFELWFDTQEEARAELAGVEDKNAPAVLVKRAVGPVVEVPSVD